MILLIYTIDQKPQAVDQRNKSSKVASLRGVAILAITSKHSNNAAAIAINALQFTNLSRRKDSKIEEMGYLKIGQETRKTKADNIWTSFLLRPCPINFH